MKKIEDIKQEIKKVITGKDYIIEMILASILAKGNILLEDVPGVGKTTLALGLSRAMNLNYRRMQFTPDVLPSDITGFSMYNSKTQEFEYKEGIAMTNLLLADEINRTSPKAQAALLEVMEENSVTVDGVTYQLPNPFIVIATQNPIGYVGTQKLPESQLDRFMIKLSMGYPEQADEINIYMGTNYSALEKVNQVIDGKELLDMREEVEKVFMNESIYGYISDLVRSTRKKEYIELGVSPRGGIALVRMSKAIAYINDRDYVLPEDVVYCMDSVMSHRIVLSSKAKADGITVDYVMKQVKSSVDMPKGKE